MKLLYVLVFLILSQSAQTFAASNTAQVQGMVREVFDGDSMLVVTRSKGTMKVRLYGIDAPETEKPDRPGQEYGDQARRVLKYKILGKEVLLDVQDKDQYSRSVAVVRIGRRDINAEMVAEGMAWAYRRYLEGPYASEYIQLEEKARRRRLGLWRQANPKPPWEFRHGGEQRGKKRR